MILRTLPEGMAATSTLVEAITARLAAAHVVAAPVVTAVVPPAIDSVSITAAAELSASGAGRQASGATGVAELGGSSLAVADSGLSYQEGDLAAAAAYALEI
ncbi:MAG: PE family protein [Segniliparus sp.]|uniref:PE family protein n=1 Tax=Segniliparus sp. TaxID=2804064 RepID=UPI003F2D2E19